MLMGVLALGLGLATMGCQGGDTGPGSKDEGIKKAKEAGEKTQQMLEKMKDKKGGAAGDENKDKAKEKDKDKDE
jgi:hypothetical protein